MDKSIVPVNQIAVRSSTGYEFSNSNSAEVVEIEDDPVEVVEKQMEDLKLDHQFDEKDVPQIFKTLVNEQLYELERIALCFDYELCTLTFDGVEVSFEQEGNDWMIYYECTAETIKTEDLEKSIIDHLWFVLKNPNIKLTILFLTSSEDPYSELDSHNKYLQKKGLEKLNTLLRFLMDSIDHQIHTKIFYCKGYNEDTFLSMLQRIKPGSLESITLEILWKEEGNYQKLEEIVETDQWKQVKRICSSAVIPPLKLEHLLHCELFTLSFDEITPEDVLDVAKHLFNSAGNKCCTLSSKDKNVNVDPIMDYIKSQIDGSKTAKIKPVRPRDEFCYGIVKFEKCIFLSGDEHEITIQN